MQTTAVNNAIVSQRSSGQAAGGKTDTDEFGLVMAALQLLPGTGSAVPLPAQNGLGDGNASLTGTASTVGNVSKKDIEQLLEGSGLSPGVQVNPTSQPGLVQTAISIQNQEAVLNQNIAITGNSKLQQLITEQDNGQLPLNKAGLNQVVPEQPADLEKSFSGNVFSQVQTQNENNSESGAMVIPSRADELKTQAAITGKAQPQLPVTLQNDGQVAPVQAGLKQVVEDSVKRRDGLTTAQNDTAVFPSGEEVKQVVLGRQTGLPSSAGNVLQAAQKENKSVSEAGVQKAFTGAETVREAGKESGANTENAKALQTKNQDKIELLKTGAVKDSGQTLDNSLQPNAAPNDIMQPSANIAENPKSVALPDLKDRLVQEIKSFINTGRNKPQTQVQLKLEPEHLGQLTIKLYLDRDALSAHFYTGNNHVKEILEGSLQQLRDSLNQNDLRLNEALVFTNDGGQGGSMEHSFEERNGRAWSANNAYDNRMYADTQVAQVNLPAITGDSLRVNYLI